MSRFSPLTNLSEYKGQSALRSSCAISYFITARQKDFRRRQD
nr:uncharacterized protein CTRU02_05006 [Colletotrichum truncatum]KAF6794805.1 hypothetical protein CTRU02_05006 [Colletotrichum truncatum]